MSSDYSQVREDIKAILEQPSYDDGSAGPVLVRLAWHTSGTYDVKTKTGGSNGATMRFQPESSDPANAGLDIARNFLEPIKAKHPWISYADLWTLAGVVAIEALGGPVVPWKPGRVDYTKEDILANPNLVPPNGRLPDASLGQQHVRDIFYRMGFNDREIVALLGAHSLGRAHANRSGYDGPWTMSPTRFSNQFYKLLMRGKWTERQWSGPRQFTDATKRLMMTPADLALQQDKEFFELVKLYAEDKDIMYKDFASAFSKLIELGVPRRESKL